MNDHKPDISKHSLPHSGWCIVQLAFVEHDFGALDDNAVAGKPARR